MFDILLGAPSFLVTYFWWIHQPSHQFQIINFFVSGHQNVMYNSVAINILYLQSQINYTAHFGDLNQKKMVIWNLWLGWWLRQNIGDLNGRHALTCLIGNLKWNNYSRVRSSYSTTTQFSVFKVLSSSIKSICFLFLFLFFHFLFVFNQ